MKSNRSYNNNNSKSDGNRPPSTRSYSSVASQPHNPPPPSLAPPAPVPAPAAAAAPVRSSPSTVTEGALNQIHAYVRGLNKSDQDTHRLTFMHLIQSMIGKEVQVDLKDGSIVTGVLHTTTFPLRRQVEEGEYFSGDFPKQVLLKAAKLKQSGSSGRSFEAGAALFIDYADVISLVANIGDLHHRAVSADFRTDSSIKKQDLSFLQGRELQGVSDAWLDPTKATDLAPQTGKQWDQFETNRVLFNVNSTYDENIYTKKLDKSSFTAEQVARAERLAREIEKQQSGNIHLLEERGLLTEREIDEEAMYSGVIRHDYQPEVPLVSSSSHGNTPTNRSNGHSNSGSSKSNRAAQPDTPWQRGLKLNDSGKRAPVPAVEPVQQAPAISNPPPLAPAPGLIDRNNVPSPSTQQQRDRVSPVRFGAFHDQQPPSATVKTSTPTLESGFSKVSLDEANQKPLPALTPNPAVAAAVANVSNNESISRSASGPVGGLPTSTSNHSLQDSAKTTPVKESEEKTASSKLNPSAKAFVPNINAKVFTPSVPVPVPVPVPVVDVPPPVPVYTAPVVPVAPPPAPVPVPVQVPVQVPVTPVTKTVPPPVVPHVTPTAPVQPHVPYVQPPTPPVVHNNYPISASVSHDSPAAQRLNPSIKNSPSVAPMMNPAVTSSPSTMSIPPPANVPNMSVPTPVYNMMYTPEQLLAMQQQAYYDPTLAYYQQQQQQQQQQHYFYQQQQYLAMMQQQQQYVMSNPGMVAQQPYVAAGMPQQQQQQQQQHMYYSNGQVTNQPMPGANYAFGYDQNGMQYQQTGFQQQPSYYPNAATHQQPLQRSNSGYSQGSKGPRKNMNNVSGGGGRRYNGGGGGGYSQHSNSPQTHDRHDNDHPMNDNSPNDVYSPESS